jgi:hypothetical protein
VDPRVGEDVVVVEHQHVLGLRRGQLVQQHRQGRSRATAPARTGGIARFTLSSGRAGPPDVTALPTRGPVPHSGEFCQPDHPGYTLSRGGARAPRRSRSCWQIR